MEKMNLSVNMFSQVKMIPTVLKHLWKPSYEQVESDESYGNAYGANCIQVYGIEVIVHKVIVTHARLWSQRPILNRALANEQAWMSINPSFRDLYEFNLSLIPKAFAKRTAERLRLPISWNFTQALTHLGHSILGGSQQLAKRNWCNADTFSSSTYAHLATSVMNRKPWNRQNAWTDSLFQCEHFCDISRTLNSHSLTIGWLLKSKPSKSFKCPSTSLRRGCGIRFSTGEPPAHGGEVHPRNNASCRTFFNSTTI